MKTLKQLRSSLDSITEETDPLFELFLDFIEEYDKLLKPFEVVRASGELDIPDSLKDLLIIAFAKGALSVLDIKRFGFNIVNEDGVVKDTAYFSDEELQHSAMLMVDVDEQKAELDEAIAELIEIEESDPVLH